MVEENKEEAASMSAFQVEIAHSTKIKDIYSAYKMFFFDKPDRYLDSKDSEDEK